MTTFPDFVSTDYTVIMSEQSGATNSLYNISIGSNIPGKRNEKTESKKRSPILA